MILSCKNVKKTIGTNTIIENITFGVEKKDKLAIVGVNGAGKTTLFKILTDQTSYDSGDIYIPKDIKFGYFEQNANINSENNIFEEMMTVFSDIFELEKTLRDMEEKMKNVAANNYDAFMENYSKLSHEFELKDGYSITSKVKGVLKGLGFVEEDYKKSVNLFSGGQKTRICLGKILLESPDILLLDEPTNHLDLESISWLEDFLKNYDKTVILISHDRYFIDKIVSKIMEIENKKSTIFNGDYTFYVEQKELIREIELKHFINQQKDIKKQEEVIKTLRSFNREKSVKRAESREKALKKIELVDRPSSLPSKMRLILKPQVVSGNDVLFIEDLEKNFEDKTIFKNANLDIKRGDKVAIIGANGIGKSTLFKMILDTVDYEIGEIKCGMNVKIGYYDQEQQYLNENNTIIEEIASTYPKMTVGEIRNVLACFVFIGDDVFKTIRDLSGGEKGRVALAKIMLSEANFLMLDEPTNHLDMFSKEILENAINSYEGTVLYISHDRYFINRTALTIAELTFNGINTYMGDYDYYLEKRFDALNDDVSEKNMQSTETTETKNNWLKQKDDQARERKKLNDIKKVEDEIANLEDEIDKLDKLLFDEKISCDVGKSKDVFDKKQLAEEKLEALFETWEELQI